MRPTRLISLFAMLTSLSTVGIALAASLAPLTSATIAAFDLASGPTAPQVVTYTTFPFAVGTNLNGAPLEGGGAWVAQNGTWEMGPDGATLTKAVKNSRLVTNIGRVDATVVADITWSRVPFRTGVIVNSNGTNALMVTYESIGSNRVEITGITGNSSTSLAVVAAPASTPPIELRVVSSGNTILVYVDGTLLLTYTLSAAQMTTYKSPSATFFGIATDQKRNGSVLGFRVEV